jgi:membrane fusion protein (multidrug efflux system)
MYHMKIKLLLFVLPALIISCSSDKQADLNKLRKQQNQIAEQIKKMESDTSIVDPSATSKQKLVGIKELVPVDFNHYIEVQGKLDGDENVGISPQAPGKLEAILVSVGENVRKGQMLARLDDAVMQQQLKQMQTNLSFLTEVYEKQKRLWDQKVGSEVQYLSAKTSKESMEQQIATLRNQIETMQITSPINGTIEDINVKAGQIVSPGLPIIRVVNFERIKVVADIAESYSNKIKPGDKVKIFFPDLSQEINATVTFSSRYINPVNRSFSVEARIAEPIAGLKVNMVAIMKINDYYAPNSIAIPVNLLQKDRDQDLVFIAGSNSPAKAVRVPVTTGVIYEGLVEIKSGLKPGDRLITIGYQEIEDGQAVRF